MLGLFCLDLFAVLLGGATALLSNELGELESGLTARWLGAVGSVIFGGIGTLLIILGSTAIFPEIRKLGRLHN